MGKIRIVVPWQSLRSRHIEAHVEEIYLVIGPRRGSDFSEDAERRAEQHSKQERLSRAAILRKSRAAIDESWERETTAAEEASSGDFEPSSPWFYERWISNIVDNVQVSVSNIHLRYEDDESIPGRCFSAGVTLDSIQLQSTDADWTAGFVTQVSEIIYKALTLNHLAVYVNPFDEPVLDDADAPGDFAVAALRLAEKMKNLVRPWTRDSSNSRSSLTHCGNSDLWFNAANSAVSLFIETAICIFKGTKWTFGDSQISLRSRIVSSLVSCASIGGLDRIRRFQKQRLALKLRKFP